MWLREWGDAFWKNVQVATLAPFHGYKNAIDDQSADAVVVLDAYLSTSRDSGTPARPSPFSTESGQVPRGEVGGNRLLRVFETIRPPVETVPARCCRPGTS